MGKKFSFFKHHQLFIFRALIFLLAALLVSYLLPKEGKFKYEYKNNYPWTYEDLIAPFDFSIHKTDKEVQSEKDSTEAKFIPYFDYDSTVYVLQVSRLKDALSSYLDTLILEEPYVHLIENQLIPIFQNVYFQGIVSNDDLVENVLRNKIEFHLIAGNISETIDKKDVLNQMTAYEKLKRDFNQLQIYEGDSIPLEILAFLGSFNLNQVLEPNVIYNEEVTEKAKSESLSKISLTKGMIRGDELIISEGEPITDYKFQVLESLKKEYEIWIGESSNYYVIILGKVLVVLIAYASIFLFLFFFRREILDDIRKTFFILILVTLFVILASIASPFDVVHYYVLPFTMLPILIRTFYDDRLALFIHNVTIFLVGFIVPNAFEFIFLNFIAGVVAVFSMTSLYRRRRLFITSILVFLSYAILFFALSIVYEGDITQINTKYFLWFAINCIFILLVYPMLYIFEKLFGFISEVTLMELSDTNQRLLRRLAEDAPGTFQHSMQVANLAEDAVYHIGGNALLVRTGALYHDIGKISDPVYFIENQKSSFNPHDHMAFEESAEIIIRHVRKGEELARKHKLPEPIIDFIRTHHGTTVTRYFYNKQVAEKGDGVDIELFRYPGPKPFSKEMAVLMMADSVEAASRSLKDMNQENIHALVENIIDKQMTEGQFNNADITFKDITRIKEVFKKKLSNIYHVRISYPDPAD